MKHFSYIVLVFAVLVAALMMRLGNHYAFGAFVLVAIQELRVIEADRRALAEEPRDG